MSISSLSSHDGRGSEGEAEPRGSAGVGDKAVESSMRRCWKRKGANLHKFLWTVSVFRPSNGLISRLLWSRCFKQM